MRLKDIRSQCKLYFTLTTTHDSSIYQIILDYSSY